MGTYPLSSFKVSNYNANNLRALSVSEVLDHEVIPAGRRILEAIPFSLDLKVPGLLRHEDFRSHPQR